METDDHNTSPISLFWATPSVALGVVTVFVAGFILGPIHPIVMDEVGNVFPRWLRPGVIGWIGAVGIVGSRITFAIFNLWLQFKGTWWFLPL
jgi:hypothetical protein